MDVSLLIRRLDPGTKRFFYIVIWSNQCSDMLLVIM